MNKTEILFVVIPNMALHAFIADLVRIHVNNLAQQGGVINIILVIAISLIWWIWKGVLIFFISKLFGPKIRRY